MSGHVSLSMSRYAEGESGNGEVNGMATNHLQGRSSRIVSRGWEAEGGERGSLSDTNFVPPDENTQKLSAFVGQHKLERGEKVSPISSKLN